jgi:hypothetical protein
MPKKLQRESKVTVTFEPSRMQDEYLAKTYEMVMQSTKNLKTENFQKNQIFKYKSKEIIS